MPSPVTSSALVGAPKALLHDHLDGGLRIGTILELSDSLGCTSNLPTTNPDDLQAWFTAGAAAKDLLQYLPTFEHTLAVMQTTEHIERIADRILYLERGRLLGHGTHAELLATCPPYAAAWHHQQESHALEGDG